MENGTATLTWTIVVPEGAEQAVLLVTTVTSEDVMEDMPYAPARWTA